MPKLLDFRAGLQKLSGAIKSVGALRKLGALGGRDKDIFTRAVQGRQVLAVRYDGHIGYLYIEAYVYGRRENGFSILQGYMLGQDLPHGQAEGWVTLTIADIVSANPDGRTFPGDRPRPARDDQFATVIAELTPSPTETDPG